MKSKTVPRIIFGLFAIAFVGYLISSGASLPERLATHFDWHGQPNDWTMRNNYLLVFGALGTGAAIIVVAICFAVRFFPTWTINIPRRDYWLVPERRTQTFDFLLRWGFWLGCLFLGFLAGVHHLVVQANTRNSVVLPSGIALISGAFAVGLVVWTAFLLVHFGKRARTDAAA